ncbi:hypothetical protein [Pedobacter sp. ASV28]|jgi:hypothetical protein|uniref:hypothetical protein n=1 Tax=Pedobacter sp. ASV28 TaxID=2795123 RepID=UPI0018EBC393|nr:hypothetical protein [Pedobacter sp. ASV28]
MANIQNIDRTVTTMLAPALATSFNKFTKNKTLALLSIILCSTLSTGCGHEHHKDHKHALSKRPLYTPSVKTIICKP